MSHKKFGSDRFSRFDVYWIQTDRQTDRQAKFIYRLYRILRHVYKIYFFIRTKMENIFYFNYLKNFFVSDHLLISFSILKAYLSLIIRCLLFLLYFFYLNNTVLNLFSMAVKNDAVFAFVFSN